MKEVNSRSRYISYNLIVCFAVYWFSNLLLWYPWSINETLGIVLMLTVNPIIWGYASYICISKYPKANLLHGTIINSFLFIAEAIISDLVFFGLIRNAMDEIMKPTTMYGWCFVVILPFIIYGFFKKKIKIKPLTKLDFKYPIFIGLASLVIIVVILLFNIKFGA